jgi:hypothetical protein
MGYKPLAEAKLTAAERDAAKLVAAEGDGGVVSAAAAAAKRKRRDGADDDSGDDDAEEELGASQPAPVNKRAEAGAYTRPPFSLT